MNAAAPGPVVLCVLDGWGHRNARAGNAVRAARTPVMDRLAAEGRSGLLAASGAAVGLPDGQMGNSEVGHMSIGAGRVIPQDLPRITRAAGDGSLAAHPLLGRAARRLRESGGACHVAGLLSPGGVHSHQDHIAALCRILADAGVPVRVHAFLDGRDTPPRSALGHLARFEESVRGAEGVRVATVAGRYWAMDRDRRWDRTERAWRALALGEGRPAASAREALERSYREGTTDEFMEPAVVGGHAGIRDGDGLVSANFRADRARQLLAALADPGFDAFPARRPALACALSMGACSEALDRIAPPLFPAPAPEGTLGETVAAAGLRQLRAAETEKYAHVTFFLNGGREEPFPGEERALADSPRVATYDEAPEMAAAAVTGRIAAALEGRRPPHLVVANYANADMVGHTGDLRAAVRAVEAVDSCLGRVAEAARARNGLLLVTADHGNAEQMGTKDRPHTAHTTNPVPAVLHGAGPGPALRAGALADLAPTVLDLLGLAPGEGMTGRTLLAGG